MNVLEAVVLGVVQGLTEFLPVSSSAHLVIVPWLLGWESPGLSFDAALHLGTLSSVIVYFRNDLLAMARALPGALAHPWQTLRGPSPAAPAGSDDPEGRLALLIIAGTIPGAVVGLLAESKIEAFYHGDGGTSDTAIVAIAIALIALGAVLLLAEQTARHIRPLSSIRLPDALIIGLSQALAIIPGVSRSGSTLTAGLFRDLKRADAARFSFLLGSPIIAVAGLKGLYNVLQAGLGPGELSIFAIGIVVSAISGFFAISTLLRYLQRASTRVFIAYRFAIGLLLLALIVTGLR